MDEVLYRAHKLDEVLYGGEKAMEEWREKAEAALEEALREAKRRTEEAMDDLKWHVDQKKGELWELAKEKYISKTMTEAIDLLADIMEDVKDFREREVKEGFRTPIFALLAMIMAAQGKRAREWIQEELAATARQTDEDRERFELHRRLGRFALELYDATWAGTREEQAAIAIP